MKWRRKVDCWLVRALFHAAKVAQLRPNAQEQKQQATGHPALTLKGLCFNQQRCEKVRDKPRACRVSLCELPVQSQGQIIKLQLRRHLKSHWRPAPGSSSWCWSQSCTCMYQSGPSTDTVQMLLDGKHERRDWLHQSLGTKRSPPRLDPLFAWANSVNNLATP